MNDGIARASAHRYGALATSSASLSCGRALDVAAPREGEDVVDLGCGRGGDVVRAAARVGPLGSATGVDASDRMLAAAAEALADSPNARVVRSDLSAIPLPDRSADVVVSNCAINHAPDKRAVYREMFRLLRPGGRFAVSDVVSEEELPESVRNDPAAWAACYGGSIPEADYLAAISGAGLRDVEVVRRTDPHEKGGVRVLSITVTGRRPKTEARMRLSRHTILAPVPGRDLVLLIQPLTGQAALLEPANARALEGLAAGAPLPAELSENTLREAGFVVDSDDEDRAFTDAARTEWRTEAEKTPTQLVVVPSFGCNLACTYCYQELFDPAAAGLISPEAVDAFFAYVDRHHEGESPRPYITLFGGEPLRDTPAHHDRIRRFLDGARARKMEVAAVTNGHDLLSFLPLLSSGPVKEVQVTLDGPAALHDHRRPHAGGAGTFDRIVAGIDGLVAALIPVNLRVVADRENLPALPDLASFAEARGWLDLPSSRFKTQIGRNYELFGCASRQAKGALFDRVELWAKYVEMSEAHPVLRRFHQPRFHGIGHLADAGELPAPNFDACPAAKKEWAFGPDGGVFGCTATVGHPEHRLGSFFPEVSRNDAAIARWQGRSTLSIPACDGCALAPVCGGGCGAVAWREHGTPIAPDCRPVPALYGLGARYYELGA